MGCGKEIQRTDNLMISLYDSSLTNEFKDKDALKFFPTLCMSQYDNVYTFYIVCMILYLYM